MARILAVDTSGPSAIVVLSRDGDLHDIRFDDPGGRVDIAKHVYRLLAQLEMDVRDLTNLAVGVGPGRFIRTRIGVAFINGLASATRLPITPVDSLAILGYACVGDLHAIGSVREEVRGRLIAAWGLLDPDSALFNPAMPWKVAPKILSTEEFAGFHVEGAELWAVDGESSEISLEDKYGMEINCAKVHGDAKARSLLKLAIEGVKRNRFVIFASPQYHRDAV